MFYGIFLLYKVYNRNSANMKDLCICDLRVRKVKFCGDISFERANCDLWWKSMEY